MELNYFDSSDVKVSENLSFHVDAIGEEKNHPIIVIDGILENPDSFVSKIVQKLPLELNEYDPVGSVFPGHQSPLFLKFPQLRQVIAYFIHKKTDFEIDEPNNLDIRYQLNTLHTHEKHPRHCIQPHVDPSMFAFVLYLNPEEECAGGTSFYKHSTGGEVNMEHVSVQYKREEPYWNYKEWEYDFVEKSKELVDLDEDNIEDVWEGIYTVPMKYNRLVLYPSYLWHTATYNKTDFIKSPRVSLSGFVGANYFVNE